MGKKRSQGFKPFQAVSSSANTKPTLSVNEKLHQLRLEARPHRFVGSAAPSLDHSAGPSIPAHPDLVPLLGLKYQVPDARVRPKSQGHIAPKSWLDSSRPQGTGQRKRDEMASQRCAPLSELCLDCVARNINRLVGFGMHHLPPHLKEKLLSRLDGHRVSSHALQDLVPEEEDEIGEVNLQWLSGIGLETTSNVTSRDAIKMLKRLTGLRNVTLAADLPAQFYAALPRVLETICLTSSNSADALSHWSTTSKHFLALRCITLQNPDFNLLQMLADQDWNLVWRTVTRICFVSVPYSDWDSAKRDELGSSGTSTERQFMQGWLRQIRKERSPGRRLEIVFGPTQSGNNLT